jgi:hypothetical protein
VDASLVDMEGLPMIAVRDAAWREAMERFTPKARGAKVDEGTEHFGAS